MPIASFVAIVSASLADDTKFQTFVASLPQGCTAKRRWQESDLPEARNKAQERAIIGLKQIVVFKGDCQTDRSWLVAAGVDDADFYSPPAFSSPSVAGFEPHTIPDHLFPQNDYAGQFEPGPLGIDVHYAWRYPGGDGEGVTFYLMEERYPRDVGELQHLRSLGHPRFSDLRARPAMRPARSAEADFHMLRRRQEISDHLYAAGFDSSNLHGMSFVLC